MRKKQNVGSKEETQVLALRSTFCVTLSYGVLLLARIDRAGTA